MHKLRVVLCSAVFSTVAFYGASAASAEDRPDEVGQISALQIQRTAAEAGERTAASAAHLPEEMPAAENVKALAASADPYEVKSFFADFTHFSIGDTAPALYRSKRYEVTPWAVRHLSPPVADSHWTYMGGNYVMIENESGKILKAESGEIYYKH